MASLKRLAKLRLSALAAEQQLLAARQARDLMLMGWCPKPCDHEEKEAKHDCCCQSCESVPVVVLPAKRKKKVKTKDKIEIMMIIWLVFGVSAFVALFGLLLATLFFASGVVTVGGGTPAIP